MSFYLARQPIFDRHQVVIGYDILYKDEQPINDQTDITNLPSSAHLLLNRYLDTDVSSLLGGHIGFLLLDETLILKSTAILLNKDSTVIQIAPDIQPSDALLYQLYQLKAKGFLIALLGYTRDYPHTSILKLSDIVEVNFKDIPTSQLTKLVSYFKLNTQILMAKGIEDHTTYQIAYTLGFELFEGYYFAKPSFSKGSPLQQSVLNNIAILKLVNTEDPDVKLIATSIEKDVTLTLRLLRLVNSTHYFVNKIQSVQHALVMLGMTTLKSWLNLVLLDSFITHQSSEVIKLAMVRMWLMEHVGLQSAQHKDIDALKLIGLLSILDILLDKDMMDAIDSLPIDNSLKLTLLGENSKYSDVYQLVLAYEKGYFDNADNYAKKIHFNIDELPLLYTQALTWSDKVYAYLYPSTEDR